MSIFDIFSGNQSNGSFNLYDNNYLSPDGTIANNANAVIKFTNMLSFNPKYDSTVAQEVMERGGYNMDSKQNKATLIRVTASYVPLNNINDLKDQCLAVQKVVRVLEQYKIGVDLVTISMENPPMFNIYADLLLVSFEHELNQYNTGFVADMTFLQTRQNQTNQGALPQDQVSSDNYASQVDNGEQNAVNTNGLGF